MASKTMPGGVHHDSAADLEKARGGRKGRTCRIGDESVTASVEGEEHLALHRKDRSMGKDTRQLIRWGIQQDKYCALLGEKEIELILQTMQFHEFKAKDSVVRQGDFGKTFFVTHEGSLEVSMNGKIVNTMVPGHAFGGIALVYNCPRTATVTAVANSSAWGAHGDAFYKVLVDNAKSHYAENRKFLGSLSIFEGLPVKQMDRVGESMFSEVFEKGVRVITEGEAAGAMYFVKKGALREMTGATIAANGDITGGSVISKMGPGVSFGERELLYNEPRTSTIVAEDHCELLVIAGEALKEVLGDDLNAYLQKNFILMGLRKSPLISQFSSSQHTAIVSNMTVRTFGPGEPVAPGYRFVVVIDGFIEGVSNSSPVTLKRGGWYEEDAIIESEEMDAAEAQEEVKKKAGSLKSLKAGLNGAKLGILTKESITQVFSTLGLSGNADEAIDYTRKMNLAKKVHIFRQLAPEQLDRVVKAFVVQRYVKGAVVIKQGEIGTSFFVIAAGEVKVTVGDKLIRTLAKNAYVGERALLFDEPRSATVEVSSSEADLWFIDKSTFSEIVKGGMMEILSGRIRLQDTNVDMKDLKHVKVVGAGAAGVVRLVEHKTTKTRYALKRVMKSKGKIPEEVARECTLLKENDHPFIMCLVKTFETKKSVYMLTELITGGELHAAIRTIPTVLSRAQAQFYSGSLVLVLEELCDRNIVYRDLKPENVMLDNQGYLKLIDFGIAKKLEEGKGKTFTMIGTPHYMAPEVMRGHGYTTEIDIWSLGVMIFELVCGFLPFADELDEPTEVCTAVLKDPLAFPAGYKDKHGKELMQGMMCRQPKRRLGAGINGYDDIKNIEYYKVGHDASKNVFNKILGRELQAPVVPGGETYCDPEDVADILLSDSGELG